MSCNSKQLAHRSKSSVKKSQKKRDGKTVPKLIFKVSRVQKRLSRDQKDREQFKIKIGRLWQLIEHKKGR